MVNKDEYKTTRLIFSKFDGKVVHVPQKKQLNFGRNPDHIMLGLGSEKGYSYLVSNSYDICTHKDDTVRRE